MAGLYEDGFVEQLRQGLCGVSEAGGLASNFVMTLNILEKSTFKAIDAGTGQPVILRVPRPGNPARDEIFSEISWILDRDGIVATPKILARIEGVRLGDAFLTRSGR